MNLPITIKNLDGEVFLFDEGYSFEINLGNDVVAIPWVHKINDERVIDVKIVDIELNKKVRDENDPNSEGGWYGTVTLHYFVDKQVSYFEGATLDPEILKQQLRNYYEVEYYVAYTPMLGLSDIFFNTTMESISKLIEDVHLREIKENAERKEQKNGKA